MGFSTKVQVSHRRVRGLEGGSSVFHQPGWNLASDDHPGDGKHTGVREDLSVELPHVSKGCNAAM